MKPNLTSVEIRILHLLRSESLYGHLIWKRLSELYGTSRSTVYASLERLARLGYVTMYIEKSHSGPPRHLWHSTRKGLGATDVAWSYRRHELADRLRTIVTEYRVLLTELSTVPSVGEEAVPYTVGGLDAGTQVSGHLTANASNMGIDGVTLGEINQAPAVLPNLHATKNSPRLRRNQGQNSKLPGS